MSSFWRAPSHPKRRLSLDLALMKAEEPDASGSSCSRFPSPRQSSVNRREIKAFGSDSKHNPRQIRLPKCNNTLASQFLAAGPRDPSEDFVRTRRGQCGNSDVYKLWTYISGTILPTDPSALIEQNDGVLAARRLPLTQFLLPGYDIVSSMKFDACALIDSHCHLDFLYRRTSFDEKPISFSTFRCKYRTTMPKSLRAVITVCCQPYSWLKTSRIVSTMEPGVNFLFGCHPHFADDFDYARKIALKSLVSRPGVVGLGEIGLDYSEKNKCSTETQKKTFAVQLQMAIEKDLPLCLHIRNATEDGMEVMAEAQIPRDHPIHLHCFTEPWSVCQRWLHDYPCLKVGITPVVTRINAKNVHEVARKIPLDRLVLETDAPYFMPQNFHDEDYDLGANTHPGFVIHAAAQIAAIRGLSLHEIIEATTKNAIEVYRLDKSNTFTMLGDDDDSNNNVARAEQSTAVSLPMTGAVSSSGEKQRLERT